MTDKTLTYNIADLYESVADAVPDATALVCGEWRRTFAELDARANQLAHWLQGRGVGPGDHVGVHLYNCDEYVETMLAAFKIRAVPININYRYVADELAYLFDNADLAALVHQRELTPVVREVLGRVAPMKALLVVDDDSGEDADDLGSVDYERAMLVSSPERDFGPRSSDDIYVVYTGGTTGMPRGVMWRHEDVFFAGLQGGRPGGEPITRPEELAEIARAGDTTLTVLPAAAFIHGAAQWGAWIALFSGGKAVISPGKTFRPRHVLELIEAEQVHTLLLVGDAMARPIADILEAEPGRYAMDSVLAMASGGAVLSKSVQDILEKHLPNAMILNNFGASETGHQGTAVQSDDGTRMRFAMDASNAVLDEALRPIAAGSGLVGRLARRGYLPLGYYKDEAKTAATFVVIDGERWVVPGDMATVEADGLITVLGRGSVCINSGGEKVFPEEVEEALKAHAGVYDAVVVGVPDERWGNRVTALVTAREGKRLTAKSLETHCRKKVAGYKVPRAFHVVETIARQPSGKPDYRWAKDRAMALEAGEA
ncbi:MAG: acyl-CoA synthetase [Deltaproteobacteria bacterium]|nr:acyl-CoA synthetase [Deltaproteobacteria bacterium]MCB9788474.1 acyl-CoA synthetase [Deltaproteobacteria bacterium]